MPRKRGPTVARNKLGHKLRRARTDAKKTQKDVAQALDWSVSKLLRIENGEAAVAVGDVFALLTQYPNLAGEQDALAQLARETRSPRSADAYQDVLTPQFKMWLEHEAYAEKIFQYEPILVPGILQTDRYARTIIEALLVEGDPRDPNRIADSRRSRVTDLMMRNGPSIEFVIDEAVLLHEVGRGGQEPRCSCMIEQIEHIRRMNTIGRRDANEDVEEDVNPNVAVYVVKFSVGAYEAMRTPFEVITFGDDGGDEDEDMMYLEGPQGDIIVRHSPQEVNYRWTMFDHLKTIALSPVDTNSHLDQLLQETRG